MMRVAVLVGLLLVAGAQADAESISCAKLAAPVVSDERGAEVWAKSAYFGGYRKFSFVRGNKSVLVIIGMCTSGVATSEITVFDQRPDGRYALLVSRTVRHDFVNVRETSTGIEFYSDQPVLILPWTGVGIDWRWNGGK